MQEGIGDPLSNDPADIYITFDEFGNGTVRGRQVCAIYVDHPGFVELTLAPEGWSPETGRPPTTPTPTPPRARESEQPFVVASAEEAVDIARSAVPEAANWDVHVARTTRLGEYETFPGHSTGLVTCRSTCGSGACFSETTATASTWRSMQRRARS